MLDGTTDHGKMPKPGEVQEFHICGNQIRYLGIGPVRVFTNQWDKDLNSQVDPRKSYLGIVHDTGAYLIQLREQPAADSAVSE